MTQKRRKSLRSRHAAVAHAGTLVPALLVAALAGCSSKVVAGQSAPPLPPCVTHAGSVVTLFKGNVSGLAARGQDVFVTSDFAIDKLPLTGGKPTKLASTSYAYELALLGNRAYFSADQPAGPPGPQGKQQTESTLASVPLGGGSVTTVIASHPPLLGESLQASDGTSLYFGHTSELWSIDKLTPPETTLASYPLSGKAAVTSIALHDGYLYVGEYDPAAKGDQGGIQRLPVSGGTPRILIKDIGIPRALAVDDAHLYFAEDPASVTGSGRIARAGLDGSHVTTLVQHTTLSMVVAGGRLYYAQDNSIFSVPVSGGQPKRVVQGQGQLGMLRLSGGNLLWVDPVFKGASDPTIPSLRTTCL